MRIRNGKDFWTGLMFIGFGLTFMLTALNYSLGAAMIMGPGYFPAVLGGLLALIGTIVLLRSFVSASEHPFKVFRFRLPLMVASIAIGGATYLAAAHLDGIPLAERALVALAILLFFGAFGPKPMFMVLLAVLVFGYALGPLGMVLATVLLVVISAAGGHDFRRKDVVILTAVLALFGALVFVKGLGLPFNLWPGG